MLTPEPTDKPKSGAVWKWIGFGCGGLLLLMLLLGTGLVLFVQRNLNLSFGGQQAEELANQMMTYQIPGGSKGLLSMQIKGVQMVGITSTETPPQVVLMLGKIPKGVSGDTAALQQQVEENLKQHQDNFTVSTTRTEERSLCGQSVQVAIATGNQQVAGQSPQPATSYQTLVTTDSTLYMVALTTTGANAEALAEKVFASLNCK